MTRSEFTARFPRATEAVIRANCSTVVAPRAAPARAMSKRVSRVPRTRNAGTMTEAAYWGHLRSALRRAFRFWKPAVNALHAARVPYSGPRGQKWAYLCADCGKLFLRKNVQVDHVEPAGALTDYAHIGDFVRRLTPEDPKAFAIRCTKCHQAKTNAERVGAATSSLSTPRAPRLPRQPQPRRRAGTTSPALVP